jgi:hypothetical protein
MPLRCMESRMLQFQSRQCSATIPKAAKGWTEGYAFLSTSDVPLDPKKDAQVKSYLKRQRAFSGQIYP